MKDKQNKTIPELTPEQMDKVSGGVNDIYVKFCCKDCGYEIITDNYILNCPMCGGRHMEPERI